MLGAARAYAEANQATLLTPFILAGAMAPVTAAGVAPRRSPRRSAGWRSSSSSGRARRWSSGSFASARCRCSRARRRSARRSRRWSSTSWPRWPAGSACPFRSGGNLCASKIADAQAAYESAATLQPDDPRRRQLRPPRRRLAGGRARRRLREVHPRRRPVRDGWPSSSRASTCPRTARRSTRSSATSPGQHFLGTAAHARQLRDRVLPLRDRRQQQLRAVAGGRLARRRPARQRDLEADARRVRGAADRSTRSTRRSLEFIAQRKAVDPRLGRLSGRCCSAAARRSSAAPAPGASPASSPRRRSSSCRSRTRSTRPPSCRPAPRVSVTASPAKGIEATVALCEALQARRLPGRAAPVGADGPRPGPPARPDRVARRAPGVDRAFVVGGDAKEPGDFPDGLVAAARDGRDRPSARGDRHPVLPAGPRVHPGRAARGGAARQGRRSRAT